MKAELENLDEPDSEGYLYFKELLIKARDARNYIVHHGIPFSEGIGDPSLSDDDIREYMNEDLSRLRIAVIDILRAEDYVNAQDFYVNNKDSCQPFCAQDYISRMVEWVFS